MKNEYTKRMQLKSISYEMLTMLRLALSGLYDGGFTPEDNIIKRIKAVIEKAENRI
jgi:hypothetical protein